MCAVDPAKPSISAAGSQHAIFWVICGGACISVERLGLETTAPTGWLLLLRLLGLQLA
jgi:hypothetical protein